LTLKFITADQIMQAVQRGHVKTPAAANIPGDTYTRTLRNLVIQAVYGHWNENREPMHITVELSIFTAVSNRVKEMLQCGNWPWETPLKRTVDRRVNECADKAYWTGDTPLIGVGEAYYMPNPARFEEPARSEMLQLARKVLIP